MANLMYEWMQSNENISTWFQDMLSRVFWSKIESTKQQVDNIVSLKSHKDNLKTNNQTHRQTQNTKHSVAKVLNFSR